MYPDAASTTVKTRGIHALVSTRVIGITLTPNTFRLSIHVGVRQIPFPKLRQYAGSRTRRLRVGWVYSSAATAHRSRKADDWVWKGLSTTSVAPAAPERRRRPRTAHRP